MRAPTLYQAVSLPDQRTYPEVCGIEYLSPAQAAIFLSVSAKQLENWRRAGKGGPPFHKLGRRLVRYRVSDLHAWAEQHRVQNTAQGHALTEGGAL